MALFDRRNQTGSTSLIYTRTVVHHISRLKPLGMIHNDPSDPTILSVHITYLTAKHDILVDREGCYMNTEINLLGFTCISRKY